MDCAIKSCIFQRERICGSNRLVERTRQSEFSRAEKAVRVNKSKGKGTKEIIADRK